MKFFLFTFMLLISSHVYAINCEWWQIKYSSTIIDEHPREKTTVREHPRREYCKNKWKNADIYFKQFKDSLIVGWPHKGEVFKKWNRKEIQTVLELLPLIPEWAESKKYSFHRLFKSNSNGNPATSEITQKTIVLYDLFFKERDKKSILIHELAHHLYFNNLTSKDTEEFLALSGWTIEVSKDRKIYEVPPKNLIKADSFSSKDEDFANHLELYFKSPSDYRNAYPKLFEFIHKRYPL